jgi:hypothetical protein
MNETDLSRHNGWTFDPAREVWYAKTGPSSWTEAPGALDNPPSRTPAEYAAWAEVAPVWVRTCGHHGCVFGGAHAHGVRR